MSVERSLGLRLRTLREQRRLSLRGLADQCGLSVTAINRIERGESSPTVTTLRVLATSLEVPLASLFEDSTEQATVLTRADRRMRSDGDGISMESLGVGLRSQQLEPFLVDIEPGSGSGEEPIVHAGEEFVHCLDGWVVYQVGDTSYELHPGDSLLFEATQPHCFNNVGEVWAKLLLVFQAAEGKLVAGHCHLES